MKKIGFTGTQKGMTLQQKDVFSKLLIKINANELHHGDCIGADADAHDLFTGEIHIHPPDNSSKRAFKKGIIYQEKSYLDRNKDIVNNCDILIATPKSETEELRSGTWSTIRYAKKIQKTIFIIYPNGQLIIEKGKN